MDILERFNAAADAAQRQWDEEERRRRLAEKEMSDFTRQVEAWLKELADGSGGSLAVDQCRPDMVRYDRSTQLIRARVELRDRKVTASAVDIPSFPARDMPVDKTGFQTEFMKFMTELVVRAITLTPHK